MPRRSKVPWHLNALFRVPLADHTGRLGQVVGLMMPNVAYCAFSARPVSVGSEASPLQRSEIVAALAVTREQLDYGVWQIVGHAEPVLAVSAFANEQFASNGYIGARIYDAALVEDLLAAYSGLTLWDDWHDPEYLDGLLLPPCTRPSGVRLRSAAD